MPLELQFELALNTIVAAMLSAVIGLERERDGHPAGLRTYMLVGVGACLFTSLSLNAFEGADQARVASNIVVGIGFLGGGIVIVERDSHKVKNVTTAAGIWVIAALGMAVGSGAWFLAISVTLLVWSILSLVKRLYPYPGDDPRID